MHVNHQIPVREQSWQNKCFNVDDDDDVYVDLLEAKQFKSYTTNKIKCNYVHDP